MNRICIIGSANVDMTVTVDRFPASGETILGSKFAQYSGGKGANQAVCAAKLGVHTDFIAKMGDDGFKDFLLQSLNENGVGLEHILISDSTSTGTAFILVNNEGENQIIVISGSNMELRPAEIEKNNYVIKQSDIVLCQLEIQLDSVLTALKIAKKENCKTILNPAPACDLPDEIYLNTDFLIPNETELELLTGLKTDTMENITGAAGTLLERGVGNLIVTLGGNGVLWVSGKKAKQFPARKVTAVDTTAAGDAFNGAFAAGLSKGWDIEKAILYAIKVSSIAVTRQGAQTSMPEAKEVDALK